MNHQDARSGRFVSRRPIPGRSRSRVVAATLAAAWTLAFAAADVGAQETGPVALQRGFSSIELGMTLEQAKAALGTDASFVYRGDPEVQFVPLSERPIIEVEGRAFIDTAILQFEDDALYVLSLVLDRDRLDYFSVYESLVAQYGDPSQIDPAQAVWEAGPTRLSLERPLTVKYLDLPAFTAIVESGEMQEALDDLTRDRFLDQL